MKAKVYTRYTGKDPIMARVKNGPKVLFKKGDVATGEFSRIKQLAKYGFILLDPTELTVKELEALKEQAEKTEKEKEQLDKKMKKERERLAKEEAERQEAKKKITDQLESMNVQYPVNASVEALEALLDVAKESMKPIEDDEDFDTEGLDSGKTDKNDEENDKKDSGKTDKKNNK